MQQQRQRQQQLSQHGRCPTTHEPQAKRCCSYALCSLSAGWLRSTHERDSNNSGRNAAGHNECERKANSESAKGANQ
ncbi:hypothetical protein ACLKA7_011792 [Drosophila subpalustris]